MSEASGTTFRLGKNLHFLPFCLFVTCYDHLRDTFSIGNNKRFIRQINKNDTHLTTIICIDCARSVEHSNAVLDGQTASRTNLCLVTWRQSHKDTRWNKTAFHRPQLDRSFDIGTEINSCRLWCCILRQRMMTTIDYLDFHIFWFYRDFNTVMTFMFIRQADSFH